MNPRDYETLLRTGTPLERAAVAMKFAEADEAGAKVLIRVALDQSESEPVRVNAFARVPVTSTEALRKAVPALLTDASAPLRFWALKKAEDAGLVEFIDAIKKLTADRTEFYDLDELLSISETAARAVATLSGK